MTHDIDAIYNHGVFQPVEPLALPEGTRVHLRLESEVEVMSPPSSNVKVLSPRLVHPEQAINFQMEVRDLNGTA